MAEAVVSVRGKLAVVIANEAQFLGGVGKKVERVQRELTRIQCCLQDADSKRKGDARVQNWLNELRDVAYRIEDATDTFFLKVEYRDASFLQKLKKVCNKPKELYFCHKLGNELDDIQGLLEEISKSRVTYGIRDLPSEDKSKGEAVTMPLRRVTYSEVDENEVVGMQADKNNILELLRPEKTSRRAVITIVGAGGLGKTTLACMVYRRSMIQVLSRFTNGLIKRFKVHDILRELAMQEAGHENFVTVFSHGSNDTKPNRIIRRASLQAEEKHSQVIKYVGPNTHSLLLFEPGMSLRCSNFRLLKVIEISGGGISLKSLDELIHLKYLGLRNCWADLSSCSFQRMRSLETLDVRGCEGFQQPCDDFWSIDTLRHVLGICFSQRPLPKGIDLNHLQTLKWVTVEGAFDWKLPNLCKLGIENLSNEWVSITNLLQTSPLLVSLGISGYYDLPKEIVYPKALPNYQNLQSLLLSGKWPENVNVEASLLPQHLVKLTLWYSCLNHNPISELGKLNSLKKLCLENVFTRYWDGPIICPEGFPTLQHLKMLDRNIKDLTVAQGVMPKLTYLQVNYNTKVHLPPELQHVTIERV